MYNLKANHNKDAILRHNELIEATQANVQFESESQLSTLNLMRIMIEATQANVQFESESQLSTLNLMRIMIEATQANVQFESESQLSMSNFSCGID